MVQQDRRGWRAPVWSGVAVLCLIVGGVAGWFLGQGGAPASAAPAVMFKAPRYRGLVNQNGANISSREFHGKVQVVTFLFPYCNTFCPIIAAHLVGFENMLARTDLANRVEVVAFNVDPADTGPKQMRAFLRQYGWNPSDPHWQYLTGRPAEIRKIVTGGFHVSYEKVIDSGSGSDQASPALAVAGSDPQPIVANPLADKAHVNYDITHEDTLLVVDGKGRVRAIYDQADAVGKWALLQKVRAILGVTG
ncbi:MAG: SCO family protein [Stellaceae bacterium]